MLNKLQNWYDMHCDGDWEHIFGITIDTLDDPGWEVTIDLEDTLLENIDFKTMNLSFSDREDIHCFINEKKFIGRGSTKSLGRILDCFFKWAEQNTNTSEYLSDVAQLLSKLHTVEDIPTLRILYRDICDLPNEIREKVLLFRMFYRKWENILGPAASRSVENIRSYNSKSKSLDEYVLAYLLSCEKIETIVESLKNEVQQAYYISEDILVNLISQTTVDNFLLLEVVLNMVIDTSITDKIFLLLIDFDDIIIRNKIINVLLKKNLSSLQCYVLRKTLS